MSTVEHPPLPAATQTGSRRDTYVEWRQRIAERQAEVRHLGEPEPEPQVDPRWSPEALFRADRAPTPPAAPEPAGGGSEIAVEPDLALDVTPEVLATLARPAHARPAARAPRAPAVAEAEPPHREGVELLLRRVLNGEGSPNGRDPEARDGTGPTTAEPVRATATVAEQLRLLNTLRLEGELSDDEFKRRKRELFIRSSTQRRSFPR